MPALTAPDMKLTLLQQREGWEMTAASRRALDALFGRDITIRKPAADSMASDATSFAAYSRVPFAGTVTRVYLIPNGTLTANDTNNATVSVQKVDGDGGTAVTVASITTTVASGSWTANVTRELTLSTVAGAIDLVEGDLIGFAISKAGSGVVVPIMNLVVECTLGRGA